MKKAAGALSIDDVIRSDITISRKDLSAESFIQQMIQQMACDDTTSWCKSNDDQLECKSNVNQQLSQDVVPVASISRTTTGQPAASTSRHNQQYIQTRATIDQMLICIQSQRSRRNDNFSSSAKKSEVWTVAKKK
ncbi:hypothetical protein F511_36117 [Dorcoceras hygrometricum]|uniref:Uncharacterized protein n=1 Tax=Dorcoceras hygrometricum TaxID=472368 RepID=A0A2Z7D3B6_9LAMI|nr:hypothetical protein F511_36117 [Dorcoceras hygrometricum]